MDKQFIETRMKDLQDYLNKVVQEPEIHNSQLLRSFLSDTDDIALFMPDSVGVQAGKIIKSVPRVLKREPKEQYLDNLLVSMEATACIPPREPSLDKLIKTDETVEENEKITKKFKQDLADDKSSQGDKAWLHPPITSGNPVTLNGVMDLLIFLAINVYDVSHFKLSVLLAIKMLAQSSVEAFFHE
jgi:sorting nexin-14